MEKRMLYRIYKKQFDDCKTLNDYDAKDKTITVLIPDNDVRVQKQKRINTKIWKSYGDTWRMKEPLAFGFRDTSFEVQKYEDGFYTSYLIPNANGSQYSKFKAIKQEKLKCKTRDEALNYVENKWNEFKAYFLLEDYSF